MKEGRRENTDCTMASALRSWIRQVFTGMISCERSLKTPQMGFLWESMPQMLVTLFR